MQIKPIGRLEPNDLPFAESPDLAVRFVARLVGQGSSKSLRFDPNDIPGFTAYSGTQVTQSVLMSGLERGDLLLVFDPDDSRGPIAPLAVWRGDSFSSAEGSWKSGNFGDAIVGLPSGVDRLNKAGLTPHSLIADWRGAGGDYGQGASGGTLPSGSKQNPAESKLVLPLGAAASIAPLVMGERLPEASSEKPLHIRVGIFLDGTLNNVHNVEIFKRKLESECASAMLKGPAALEACRDMLRLVMGESYAGDSTNVIKLFDLYKEESREGVDAIERSLKVYQGGVGTLDGANDSRWGVVTGLGETGIAEQVKKAFSRLTDRIYELVSGAPIKQLTIDIFGFSRGAAASRYAAKEIVKAKDGVLGRLFQAKQVSWPSDVSIEFMGLFDTVAGVVNPLLLDASAGNGRNYPVNLDVDPTAVNGLVHLVAKDERRVNFSLSSVRSADKSLPGNFREISLPGAHSDIGGGYPQVQEETLLLYPTVDVTGSDTEWPYQTLEWDSIQEILRQKTDEGWLGEHSLSLGGGESPKLFVEEKRRDTRCLMVGLSGPCG